MASASHGTSMDQQRASNGLREAVRDDARLDSDQGHAHEEPEKTDEQGVISVSPTGRSDAPLVELDEDSPPTLRGKNLAFLIAGILLASLIVAIDMVIISTALPVISSEFSALSQLPWVLNGFFLTQAAGNLAFGQIYSILPAKQTFLACIFVFEVGSVLSATAPSFSILVLGRAISGLGAGGFVTGMHTIIGQVVRLEDRSLYYSSLGAVFTASSIVGPLVGGVLSDMANWRYCFWINLPIGAVGALAVFFALPAYPVRLPSSLRGRSRWYRWKVVDWIGNILILGMLASLVMALQWGGSYVAWNHRFIIVLLALSGLLLAVFVAWEIFLTQRNVDEGHAHAMVPMNLLRNRSISAAAVSGFFLNIIWGLSLTYLPLLYQARGTTALKSGVEILPFMVTSVFSLAIAGALVKKIGYYKIYMIIGPWIAAIGAGLLTNRNLLHRDMLIGWQLFLGPGYGMAFQNTIMAVQAEYATSPHLIPQGASIVGFCQRTGPMIGISIAGALFTNTLGQQLSQLPFALTDAQREQIRQTIQVIWSPTSPLGLSNEQRDVIVAAYVESIRHAFFVLPPACIMAGIAALFVKNWNVRTRGKSSRAIGVEREKDGEPEA